MIPSESQLATVAQNHGIGINEVREIFDYFESLSRATPPSPSTARLAPYPITDALARTEVMYMGKPLPASIISEVYHAIVRQLPAPSTASEVGEQSNPLYDVLKLALGTLTLHDFDAAQKLGSQARAALAANIADRETLVQDIHRAVLGLKPNPSESKERQFVFNGAIHFAAGIVAQFASESAPAGAAKGGNTKSDCTHPFRTTTNEDVARGYWECSTCGYVNRNGEVDVEAERKLAARIQSALDLLADATLPRDTWRDVSNVLHACRDDLAACRTKAEGAKDGERYRFRKQFLASNGAILFGSFGCQLRRAGELVSSGATEEDALDAAIAATQKDDLPQAPS